MTRARRFVAAAALSPLLLAGCTDWAGYDLDYFWGYIPALATMRTSVAFDPYEMPRLPPEHSVPMAGEFGSAPGPFTQAQLDSVAATLTNPFAGGGAPEVLAARRCTPRSAPSATVPPGPVTDRSSAGASSPSRCR